jgi:NADH dehydrogenase
LPFTILRSATLYGRRDHYLNHIAGMAAWTWPLVWLPGGGRTSVQPLWVEDLVRCILLTLARYDLVGETVSVAGEERMSYAALVRLVQEAAALPAAIPFRTPLLLTRLFSGLLFSWWLRPPVTRFWLDRFSAPDITDLDAVRYYFGFQPVTLRHHIAYLRRGGHRRRLLGLTRDRD